MGTNAAASEGIVDVVRERYGRIAEQGSSCCGGPSCCGGESVTAKLGYDRKLLAMVPDDADLGLGCGAPIEALSLQPGETVLDLGSGPGLDAFLAARQVGPEGHVIGVDMTPAMLERARASAARGGFANVEFREGRLESLPVEDATVDAITSNCVINLVPDKSAVFREIARVLKPGGRLVISDVILDGPVPGAIERDVYAYIGCIAGAALRGDYFARLEAAGLGEIEMIKDFDSLSLWLQDGSEEAVALLARTGVSRDELRGLVRSVTFRARKAA